MLRCSGRASKIAKALKEFDGKSEGDYFVGLLSMVQFGNAFCSWSICALVRAGFLSKNNTHDPPSREERENYLN